ncbi:partial [Paramuricea clavata]|uniref:Partial n=1 Tax=Paramuricea clavata TaxID=317549 RepID=A0A6S7HUR9_PARCT|nr:partial [Paramuricea clavata]
MEISAIIKMVLDSLNGRLIEDQHPVVVPDQALTSAAQVKFEGVRGRNFQGDIAIDAISFTPGKCAFQTPNPSTSRPTTTTIGPTNPTTQAVDSWDINDARVACLQLGYYVYDGIKALGGSDVPDGTGRIWLDNVACTGSEENLSNCPHNGWGSHDCRHNEDAGVESPLVGNNGIIFSVKSLRDRSDTKYDLSGTHHLTLA